MIQLYLRARYYAPSLGRFTASDPARDGANWYVYCHGDPVNYFDFLGLDENKHLRDLAKEVGAKVVWKDNTKTATVTLGDKPVDYTVQSNSGSGVYLLVVSGHSFIEYTPIGASTDTYSTNPEYAEYGTKAGMTKNIESDRRLMNSSYTERYSKKITKEREEKMFNAINNPANDTWGYINNCTVFAIEVFWAAARIQSISIVDTPLELQTFIKLLN